MNLIIEDGTVFQPSYRKLQSGTDLFLFNLSYYNGKDAEKNPTYGSIRVAAFGPLAVNASRRLKERDKVKVTGRLRHEVWEKDGQKMYGNSIVAEAIDPRISTFIENSGNSGNGVNDSQGGAPVSDEDIPF